MVSGDGLRRVVALVSTEFFGRMPLASSTVSWQRVGHLGGAWSGSSTPPWGPPPMAALAASALPLTGAESYSGFARSTAVLGVQGPQSWATTSVDSSGVQGSPWPNPFCLRPPAAPSSACKPSFVAASLLGCSCAAPLCPEPGVGMLSRGMAFTS